MQNHQSSTGKDLLANITPSASLTNTSIVAPPTGIKVEPQSVSGDHGEIKVKLQFGEETHQYVRDFIAQADQKAAFLFAGSTALIAYLNALGFTKLWLVSPYLWGITHALSALSAIGLVIGGILCALTIIPRLGGSKRGIIYFNAICEFDRASDYSDDILSRTSHQICNEKYKHIYELSVVCRAKYKSLTYGFRFGFMGVFSAIILLAIS